MSKSRPPKRPTANAEAHGKRPILSSSSSKHVRLVSSLGVSTEVQIFERRRDVPPALRERYGNLELVGQGGMGTVFKAYDPRLEKTVALKLLRDDDPELARRLLIEARAQSRIEHERVCRIYEVGEADGEPFICMQFVHGEPLTREAKNLTIEQGVDIIRLVALAVHEAHRLGIVHRDIKPGNILVERHEDGSLEPFIMDFGLAREVNASGVGQTSSGAGRTSTGAIVGTPAYMAPEQALGEVCAIDRRTDVWGLGATLYELLAGRPPFLADHPWRVLMMIASEDPPPLRSIRPALSRDLETIVMKCLERDPSRRYDSARALADDLAQFLAGNSIAARPASLRFLFWKKARQYRLALSLLAAGIVSGLVVLGVWIKGQRDAETKAQLAAELGKDITEIELFLRSAKQLPLHDIERERAIVREKLAVITARVAAAGPLGEGPGRFALGRAHLALENWDLARTHLERALQAGQSSPELDYAFGLALVQSHEKAMSLVSQIVDDAARDKRRAEVDREYRDRGLVHLRAAASSKFYVPGYVEGLLAFCELRYDVALAKAREAFDKAPWLHEAKQLEGDVLYALAGDEWGKSDTGWYERFQELVRASSEAYGVAEDIGRSDARVHTRVCALWTRAMFAANFMDKPTQEPFERARDACARAVRADSANHDARHERAMLHSLYMYARAGLSGKSGPTDEELRETIALAEASLVDARDRPGKEEPLGIALQAQFFHYAATGREAPGALDRARLVYEQMRVVNPRHAPAFDSLLHVEKIDALHDRWRGIDLAAGAERAAKLLAETERKKVVGASMYSKTGHVFLEYTRQLFLRGQPIAPAYQRAVEIFQKGALLQSAAGYFSEYLAEAHGVAAEHAAMSGGDPRPLLEEANKALERARALGADGPSLQIVGARLASSKARIALYEAKDPLAHVELARNLWREVAKTEWWNVQEQIELAQVELVALRWAKKRLAVDAAMFDAAFAPLLPHIDAGLDAPAFDTTLAEIHVERAEFVSSRQEKPERDLRLGLFHADRALDTNAHHAPALVTKGRLWLLEAQGALQGAVSKEAAGKAVEAFEAAKRENPLLGPSVEGLLEQARELQ